MPPGLLVHSGFLNRCTYIDRYRFVLIKRNDEVCLVENKNIDPQQYKLCKAFFFFFLLLNVWSKVTVHALSALFHQPHSPVPDSDGGL